MFALKKRSFIFIFLFLINIPHLNAKNGSLRGVGAGILYAAPHMATVMNPAVAAEGPPMSFYGLYRGDEKIPYASFGLGLKKVGLGASFRQEGPNKTDVYEGSLALNSEFIMIGGTYRKVSGIGEDGDISLMFDLGALRTGAVFRSVSNGANRVDAGLALKMKDRYYLELDLKKYDPFEQKNYLADLSFVVNEIDWTLGVGYDTEYVSNELQEGHLHAGVAIMILSSAYFDLHYRLQTQEWSGDNWNAGLRIFW
jgi:hypothetical protein